MLCAKFYNSKFGRTKFCRTQFFYSVTAISVILHGIQEQQILSVRTQNCKSNNFNLQILVPSTAGTSGPGYKVYNIADKIADKMAEQKQIGKKITPGQSMGLDKQIDPFTVFDAILTSRQMCEKLQCLYENLMSNNFRKTTVLKKI